MKFYLMIPIIVFSLLTACSESPTEPESVMTDPLELENGGFTTSDEKPVFGESELFEDFQDDEYVNDPYLTASLNTDSMDVYFVRIVWGLLKYDSTAATVVSFNGTASVTQGLLGVRRTIHFEKLTGDQFILPRTDPQTVSWTSTVRPHFDGILLVIVVPESIQTDGQLVIETDQYSGTFTFSELEALELLESVTEQGHEISIISQSNTVAPIDGGFLEGRWVKADSAQSNRGRFWGKWVDHSSQLRGHVKGIWGVTKDGRQVMHGKIIAIDGHFIGFMRGTYTREEIGAGAIQGVWIEKNITRGQYKGRWTASEAGKGYYYARWLYTN
ncbi:hypothetical protein JW935_22235 [candidate division KSB1 bacterium]|nr:hypothetical protein [candidate division KSB1 bacterium]